MKYTLEDTSYYVRHEFRKIVLESWFTHRIAIRKYLADGFSVKATRYYDEDADDFCVKAILYYNNEEHDVRYFDEQSIDEIIC